jgi:hypothetical protein
MVLTGALTANADYRTPDDYECLLYEEQDFMGREVSVMLYPNTCIASQDMRWNYFDNMMSSWACGKYVKADFCDGLADSDC